MGGAASPQNGVTVVWRPPSLPCWLHAHDPRRQFQRAQALTFPQGHPQEREVGFVWFLNRYGPALVDRLIDELPLEMGHHWVLTI